MLIELLGRRKIERVSLTLGWEEDWDRTLSFVMMSLFMYGFELIVFPSSHVFAFSTTFLRAGDIKINHVTRSRERNMILYWDPKLSYSFHSSQLRTQKPSRFYRGLRSKRYSHCRVLCILLTLTFEDSRLTYLFINHNLGSQTMMARAISDESDSTVLSIFESGSPSSSSATSDSDDDFLSSIFDHDNTDGRHLLRHLVELERQDYLKNVK